MRVPLLVAARQHPEGTVSREDRQIPPQHLLERGWLDGLGHGASERHKPLQFLRTRARLRDFDGAAKRHELLQVVRASRRHGLRRFARCVGCRRWWRNRHRRGRRRLPLAILVIAQRSSQHAETRQEIHVITQLGILGERKQPLHRAFEHDDQGGHQSRQEQRVVAME